MKGYRSTGFDGRHAVEQSCCDSCEPHNGRAGTFLVQRWPGDSCIGACSVIVIASACPGTGAGGAGGVAKVR